MIRGKILYIILLALSVSLLVTAAAWAFPVNQCASDRSGSDMGCTANDVSISSIAVASGSPPSCVGGLPLILDLDVTINAANAKRYDIGVFLSNDGKSTRLMSVNGGASTCSVSILPQTPLPFANLDSDGCGDIDGPGSGIFRMSSATVLCSAGGSTSGNLTIPFMVTWSANSGGVCSSNADPVATAQSKCNAPIVYQTVAVVVTPAITKTDGITSISTGVPTTYTVVITNNTGITFSTANGNAALFKDPAVANLTVTSDPIGCSASGGATCPVGLSKAAMQGVGLTIPTLPNLGSVTFSITASVNNGVPIGTSITNTASVTVNGKSNSASDTNTVVAAAPPTAAISVTPDCLFSGGTATFVMTVTNNTGGAINTVAPSALTKFTTGAAAIGAFTGPSPASIASIANGSSGTFTWTAPVTGNINDTYYVTGYATSASPAYTMATATSNTQDIDGYIVTVSPASTYAGSTNQELVWTIANYGCNTIGNVLFPVPAGWTASSDGYTLVTNTSGSQVDTWTLSGMTFTSDISTNNVQQGSSGNKFYLRFSATPSVTVATNYTFNITVTDATSPTPIVTVIPTTVTVNTYNNSTKGQGNYTGTVTWQESY